MLLKACIFLEKPHHLTSSSKQSCPLQREANHTVALRSVNQSANRRTYGNFTSYSSCSAYLSFVATMVAKAPGDFDCNPGQWLFEHQRTSVPKASGPCRTSFELPGPEHLISKARHGLIEVATWCFGRTKISRSSISSKKILLGPALDTSWHHQKRYLPNEISGALK